MEDEKNMQNWERRPQDTTDLNFLKICKDRVKLPDGPVVDAEYVNHPGAVVIIPQYDTDLILVEVARPSIGGTVIEFPAGKLEPDEDPMVCGLRELKEETGFIAGGIEYIGRILPSPGYTNENIHIVGAYNLTKGDKPKPLEAAEETMITIQYNADWVKRNIINNFIVDAKTICAFWFYENMILG